MENFKARTDGPNGWLSNDLINTDGTILADTIKPGVLLLMNDEGRFDLLGDTTISLSNKHLVYYCNSWGDSAHALGNGMVSVIPVTKQFEYDITFEAEDEALEAGFTVGPTDLLCITDGVYAPADTAGDYVIGSVKAGTATYELGGTLTIVTWGGDFKFPA